MVNMVGFHHREPVYNTAGPGEPGFYIEVAPRPTDEHPLRALLYTPTARAIWDSPEHARNWANHDGTLALLVERYLEWADEK